MEVQQRVITEYLVHAGQDNFISSAPEMDCPPVTDSVHRGVVPQRQQEPQQLPGRDGRRLPAGMDPAGPSA